MFKSDDELLNELAEYEEIYDTWTEYIESNGKVLDKIVELAGSENRALMFILLRVLLKLDPWVDSEPFDEPL